MVSVASLVAELGDNFITGDEAVLTAIVERVTNTALLLANRPGSDNNIDLLEPEIFECAKAVYLQRGAEDVTTRDAQGDNSEYKDAYRVMYQQIINHNKRLVL